MEFDLVYPIRFCIVILKFLGLWQWKNNWNHLYRLYSYMLHFIFTVLNISTMWLSVITAASFEIFTESLYMSLTETAFLAKITNIFRLGGEAVNFFDVVKDRKIGLKNSDEKNIFNVAHRTFYVVGVFYVGASYGFVIGSFAVVAFGQKWRLPYPAWMPFRLRSEYFWWAYGFQFIGMTVTCLTNVTIDMLQCYFLHHLSLLYRVIGYRLKGIGFDVDETWRDSVEVNRKILKDVTEIIHVHELVQRMTVSCERFISFPVFMQIFLSALVLCFTGYQLTVTSPLDNLGQFIGMVDFLLVMGLQIFLPCYYANQVTVQSDMLCEALYNSNWVGLPQKSRKLIYLYMEFLKKPVYIKAGKLLNVGLPVFSKTVNNAYSCFAVLIRMKN